MKTKIGLLTACILLAIAAFVAFPMSSAVVTKAESTSCKWDFVGSVGIGPDTGTTVAGQLAVQVGQGGDLTGTLTTADNKTIAMVGQLSGRAINVSFQLQKPATPATNATADASAAGQYIYGSGTIWTPVSASQPCGDNMGGTFSGPQDGDIGDWRVCGSTPIGICPPLKAK